MMFSGLKPMTAAAFTIPESTAVSRAAGAAAATDAEASTTAFAGAATTSEPRSASTATTACNASRPGCGRAERSERCRECTSPL